MSVDNSVDNSFGRLPVVAVVGRPNVGKSSLVNRVLGRREAIVEATPGVTRDRRSFTADWGGRSFEIVDTGGLEPGQEGLEQRVAEQAELALEAADVVVFVVDAGVGANEDDHVVANLLRRSEKPMLLVVNKVDDARTEGGIAEFYRLGLGDPLPVSALHGRGSGDFLEKLVEKLPAQHERPSPEWSSAAIVGRPNVGKSSLLNALLGEARAIVDPAPGTTRDPVDSFVTTPAGHLLRLVDTAGMRRRVQIADPIEYFSWLRSRGTLNRADAAFLVVDASEGVTSADQRIAEAIVEAGRACVVVLNKWDLIGASEEVDLRALERDIATRLRFVDWAPMVRTSAVTGRGIGKILGTLEPAVASHRTRLATPIVNRIVRDAQDARPHPRVGGAGRRVLYAVQAEVSPPTFVLFATGRLEESYVRYLENRIRAVEALEGSPIRMRVRMRNRAKAEV
jgi:GTP-binding protein